MAKIDIKDRVYNDAWDYCRLNNITDVSDFINKRLSEGITSYKYGPVPGEQKIKEVIIEKIIEKEVFITNEESESKLKNEVSLLNDENNKLELEVKKLKEIISELRKTRDIYGD